MKKAKNSVNKVLIFIFITKFFTMISDTIITQIFCAIDDFCKEFTSFWQKSLISNCKKRIRNSKMSLSEVMTIQVLFHFSSITNFKDFYLG